MADISMNYAEVQEKLKDYNVKNISFNEGELQLAIKLDQNMDAQGTEALIKARFPEFQVKIVFIMEAEPQKHFKKIIGISSGKGGVGKSMTALNLAFIFRDLGYRIGILDADMYTPSIAGLLNVETKLTVDENQMIKPVTTHGMEVLSMGMLLNEGESQIWQDSFTEGVFNQFLLQSSWTCDYLIVDFAGGMNAAYQACKISCPNIELLMISQPNKMVYRDVIRVFALLKAMSFKIIGFVENMTNTLYPKEKFDELGINGSYINQIGVIPFFEEYKNHIEYGYSEDYKLNGLIKNVFVNLVNLII